MNLGMNWVDLVIISATTLFAIDALRRSFFMELFDFLSFLLALLFSFLFYNFVAAIYETQFKISHGISLVLGFMTVWFLTESLFYLVARVILQRMPDLDLPFERILAMIPAALRSLIFFSLILVLVATFPVQPNLKKSVQESRIGSFLLKGAYQIEQPVKNVFGGVSDESLTFLTIKPKTDETVDLGFQTTDFKVDEASEKTMIDLVNKERAYRGIHTLEFDPKLQEVARMHSKDMFTRGYFSHYSPEHKTVADRAEQVGVQFLVIGENLAYAPNLPLAHQGLMNSEGHRANILSKDFNKIGIGVMDGGIYGMMFVQVFSN